MKFQKARAVFKRIVRKAKRKHDFEMKENINESTPAKQIWNIIRGLDTSLTGNKKGADAHPPKEIAEKFVAANYKPISSALYSLGKNINTDDDLGKPLEVAEFMQILKSKKDYSAAGIDNISYRILKQLKLDILVEICNQLNRVWRSKSIPERWRRNKLVLIQKPNKDPDDINSKRGIVLMNVFLKIINTIVKDRMYQYSEENDFFPGIIVWIQK